MYKLFLLAITIGSFIFAGSLDNRALSIERPGQNKNQYYLSEDTNSDNLKVDANRKRGKGNRGRRRGGGGLR